MPHSVSSEVSKCVKTGVTDWSDLAKQILVSRRREAFSQSEFRTYISEVRHHFRHPEKV